MAVTLVDLDAREPVVEIRMNAMPVRIGRHDDVEVCFRDRWISRFHCEIDQIDGTLCVRDLGSTHGVLVNGVRVTHARLMPGDRLTVGMTCLRVEYDRDERRHLGSASQLQKPRDVCVS